jgi:lipopolysaccharide export system protein LptA
MLFNRIRRGLPLLLAAVIVTAASAASAARADSPTADTKTPVKISSDRLTVDNKTESAVFSGNVRATQGKTVLTADALRVTYAKAPSDEKNTAVSAPAIQHIEAIGHVVIHFDDKVAKAEKAIYNTTTGILELIGPGTTVTSGANTVSGEKIIVDRSSNRVQVEGGKVGRVEAVIVSDKKILEKPAPAAAPAGQTK